MLICWHVSKSLIICLIIFIYFLFGGSQVAGAETNDEKTNIEVTLTNPNIESYELFWWDSTHFSGEKNAVWIKNQNAKTGSVLKFIVPTKEMLRMRLDFGNNGREREILLREVKVNDKAVNLRKVLPISEIHDMIYDEHTEGVQFIVTGKDPFIVFPKNIADIADMVTISINSPDIEEFSLYWGDSADWSKNAWAVSLKNKNVNQNEELTYGLPTSDLRRLRIDFGKNSKNREVKLNYIRVNGNDLPLKDLLGQSELNDLSYKEAESGVVFKINGSNPYIILPQGLEVAEFNYRIIMVFIPVFIAACIISFGIIKFME